jgi:hypothetical protein
MKEQARLLIVGGTESCETTCQHTTRGDLGPSASVAFVLWAWLHYCSVSFLYGQRDLFAQYGYNVLPRQSACKCIKMFVNDRTSVTEEECLGCRSTPTIDAKVEHSVRYCDVLWNGRKPNDSQKAEREVIAECFLVAWQCFCPHSNAHTKETFLNLIFEASQPPFIRCRPFTFWFSFVWTLGRGFERPPICIWWFYT